MANEHQPRLQDLQDYHGNIPPKDGDVVTYSGAHGGWIPAGQMRTVAKYRHIIVDAFKEVLPGACVDLGAIQVKGVLPGDVVTVGLSPEAAASKLLISGYVPGDDYVVIRGINPTSEILSCETTAMVDLAVCRI